MTCNCMGPQNGQPLCPCAMNAASVYVLNRGYPLNYPAGTWDPNWSGAAPHIPMPGVHGLTPPPAPTFTDAMYGAYRNAITNLINSTPVEERKKWKSDHNGYRIPEREKAEARWKAMLNAAPGKLGDQTPQPQSSSAPASAAGNAPVAAPVKLSEMTIPMLDAVSEPCKGCGKRPIDFLS